MATPSGSRTAVAHAISFLIRLTLLYWMNNQHPELTVVRRQSVPRLEPEAAVYEYPEHLRPFLDSLPAVPGVYLFHSESDTLPLYIGKSVNIRSRVLSHLRTPEEAAMLRQSRRISWIGTAGEIGALLLEARLIKEQQPLFNKRLRRNRQLCALTLRDGKVDVVYSRDVDFSQAPDLFGLFANRRAALAALQSLADEQKLCYGRLGLEPLSRGRACFRSALKRCAGVCCNKEHPQDARRPFTGIAGKTARYLLAVEKRHCAQREPCANDAVPRH